MINRDIRQLLDSTEPGRRGTDIGCGCLTYSQGTRIPGSSGVYCPLGAWGVQGQGFSIFLPDCLVPRYRDLMCRLGAVMGEHQALAGNNMRRWVLSGLVVPGRG